MDTLLQKKHFNKKELRIAESKFYYKESSFGNEKEHDIAYENLEGEKTSQKYSNTVLLWISISFTLVSILMILVAVSETSNPLIPAVFFILIDATLFITFFLTREDLWKIKLSNDFFIVINKKLPDEKSVDEFLSKLYAARNNYLKENYFRMDQNLPYEGQLATFKWLKSIGVINKEEYEQKYTELSIRVKPSKKIGFEQ